MAIEVPHPCDRGSHPRRHTPSPHGDGGAYAGKACQVLRYGWHPPFVIRDRREWSLSQ